MESKAELRYIFSNINDLLKFAEAKHAGLVILNSGLIIGILSSYNNIQHLVLKTSVMIGVISFGLSIALSIFSQFPTTSNSINSKKNISNPNIYFYGHLAFLDSIDFVNLYQQIDNAFTPTKFDIDIINQILVNSRITNIKFLFFKFGSYLTAIGFGVIAVCSIIKILWHL